SAGETTTSGSDGGTRFGSRKKNAIKSVNSKRNPATHQKPKAAAATPSSTGITIYGMLSFTIRNAGTYTVEESQTADHRTRSQSLPKLTKSTFLNVSPDVKGDANSRFYVPFNSFCSEKLRRSFSDSMPGSSDTAASSSTSDLSTLTSSS